MKENNKKNIIYSVSVCTEKKYKDLFANSKNKPGQQAQKYHRLLVSGLSSNKGVNVNVISKAPVTRSNYKGVYLKKDFEKFNNANYFYIPLFNIPFLKNIFSFFYIIFYLLKGFQDSKNTVIIGDILNLTTSMANLFVGRLKGIKTIGIVTDIPSYLSDIDSIRNQKNVIKRFINKFISKINELILQKFDSYVFLTQQMNDLINTKNKPYVVMEGHVDVDMKLLENNLKDKYDKKVCMYTGSLKSIYGIKMLTDAFINANVDNSELHIYGSGDFESELIQISKEHKNVKFFGLKLNDYIIKEQLKATLLINPRPTNEEYTKYSFPSKNMEYMSSGTPTLTTKLPSMPKEYYDYVYIIDDETIEGLTITLRKILSEPKEKLHQTGLKAKEFVLREKNNNVQANRIINMIGK
ncbi:MAG: glycosyltransferase [Bacillota bacterium]